MWGAPDPWPAAGACHAAYGTDGFPHALLDLSERPVLRALIGPEAERLVYLYACCDRGVVYPQLAAAPGDLRFRDRFTLRTRPAGVADLRAFMALTVANELDVLAHDPQVAADHGPALLGLFGTWAPWLSAAARHAVVTAGRDRGASERTDHRP